MPCAAAAVRSGRPSGMGARAWLWAAAGALLALGALGALGAARRRPDADFDFDDGGGGAGGGGGGGAAEEGGARRSLRYIYDPHSPLCRSLVCGERELCLLRDERTALCATKRDILRQGGSVEAARGGARCAGCAGGARPQFVCGSDNRTYSSLCRLDLHNCARRPRPAVAPRCRGFCPCAPPAPAPACEPRVMADRLLDWFSVLMGAAAPPAAAGFPAGCKPETRWMFAHLDADADGALSAAELFPLRHDARERCLRPFLRACGGGGPVGRAAWCGCLRRAARPCAALARAARRGGWAPACDARGYYRPRQCHAARAECWCVDPHGQELPRSRTKGEPACARRAPPPPPPPDDEDGAPSGDGDGDGDGDPRY